MGQIAKRRIPAPAPELAEADRRRGRFISGRASTPATRQAQDSRWKSPKCSASTTPTIPTQPASTDCEARRTSRRQRRARAPISRFRSPRSHSSRSGARSGDPREERGGIEARPGQQVGGVSPRGHAIDRRPPPRQPLAAAVDRESQRPHHDPARPARRRKQEDSGRHQHERRPSSPPAHALAPGQTH